MAASLLHGGLIIAAGLALSACASVEDEPFSSSSSTPAVMVVTPE